MTAVAQQVDVLDHALLVLVDAGGDFKPLRDNTSKCPTEITTQALLDLFATRPWLRTLECSALPEALLDAAVMGA